MAAIRGMVEVVLVVEDIDRSVAFYQDTLGLDPISPPELPVKFLRIGPARDGLPQQVVFIPRPMVPSSRWCAPGRCTILAWRSLPRTTNTSGSVSRALDSRSAAESTRSCLSRPSISTIRMATRSRSRPGAGSPPGFGFQGAVTSPEQIAQQHATSNWRQCDQLSYASAREGFVRSALANSDAAPRAMLSR